MVEAKWTTKAMRERAERQQVEERAFIDAFTAGNKS